MTESLLQQFPPKTPRERNPEREQVRETDSLVIGHRDDPYGSIWVEPRDLPPAPAWTGVSILISNSLPIFFQRSEICQKQ